MLKNTLLIFPILILTGCVERGYKLTTDRNTQTIIAERVIAIEKTSKEDEFFFQKMKNDVKVQLKKHPKPKKPKKPKLKIKVKKSASTTLENIPPKKIIIAPKIQVEKEMTSSTSISSSVEKHKRTTSEDLRMQEIARRSKENREKRLREIKKLNEIKKAELKQRITMEEKRARFKKQQTQIRTQIRPQVRKKENIVVPKLNKSEESHTKMIEVSNNRKQQQDFQKSPTLSKNEEANTKVIKKSNNKEEQQDFQKSPTQVKTTSSTKLLAFRQIKKVYHKFGNSEVHGSVIYLDASGLEVRLRDTKVYLLPKSATLDYWFSRYYLKNKSDGKNKNTIVHYLNKSTLNIEKKFEFFGVPEGTYYIIIESSYPDNMSADKKIYIAKKIEVGKYKKIQGVFSKKL